MVMNAFVKKAADYHAPVEAVFYRGVIAMALLLAYAAFKGRLKTLHKTNRITSHLGRAIAGNIGVALIFWAYALMPMADVTALLLTGPLIVTVLSALLLKEKVGPYRWSAVGAGFLGVMLIAQPSGELYAGYGVLVALAASFSGALVPIFLRDLGRTEDALTTVFYFLAFGILASGVYMIFAGQWPHPAAIVPLLGAGIAAGLQLILKTQAHRLAEVSLLSPFSYTSIVWATLIGWMFWNDLPTMSVVLGTTVVIASNLFILWRERVKGVNLRTPAKIG
jgi:drug/metabolite transporter (DMT)-like permease